MKKLGDFTWGWVVNGLLVLPFLLWLGDVQWRLIDMKSVALAKWLEKKMAADK